jgi:hypothetical protein
MFCTSTIADSAQRPAQLNIQILLRISLPALDDRVDVVA